MNDKNIPHKITLNLGKLRKKILKISKGKKTEKKVDVQNIPGLYDELKIEFEKNLTVPEKGGDSPSDFKIFTSTASPEKCSVIEGASSVCETQPSVETIIPDLDNTSDNSGLSDKSQYSILSTPSSDSPQDNTVDDKLPLPCEPEKVIPKIETESANLNDDVGYSDVVSNPEKKIDPKWDKKQAGIITWPSDQRMIVDAGPGTGKTDVACARVARLINCEDISPARIWVFSFTKTAVHEIRNRISRHLQNPDDVASIKIATLDSHAWAIHSGFDHEAKISGSYEENIAATLKKIQTDEEVQEYFESLEHIVIDEAQDIVGVRADLIVEIIEKIDDECGVSIFTDDAQAIYNFSINEDDLCDPSNGSSTLSEIIQKHGSTFGFQKHSLEKVYRTQSAELLRIFSSTRKKVLMDSDNPAKKLETVYNDIVTNSKKSANISPQTSYSGEDEDTFILYRRRVEALQGSAYLGTKPHRIRMSGLPPWIFPWVGACLSEYCEPVLNRDDFYDLWDSHVSGRIVMAPEREVAWKELVQLAGTSFSTVDMIRLRMRLGQKQPPRTFCLPEFGYSGPIVGTIHASKGREADTVRLMLPKVTRKNSDAEEETRVYFVGATRARNQLFTGSGYSHMYGKNPPNSQRIYRTFPKKPKQIQLQVGTEGDIVSESLAGTGYYDNPLLPGQIQKSLLKLAGNDEIIEVNATLQNDDTCRYFLKSDDGDIPLGFLSEHGFTEDIKFVASEIWQNSQSRRYVNIPEKINHIRLFGVRTVVLPPDSPELTKLHEPWSRSGILLAPVVLGFSTVYYR